MKFVKYCKKEHNIALGCHTIKFGTLKHYQKIEDEKFRDSSEGMLICGMSPEQMKGNVISGLTLYSAFLSYLKFITNLIKTQNHCFYTILISQSIS